MKLWFLTVLVLGLLVFTASSLVQAQSITTFTLDNQFDIPQNNGSIRFAYPGNYSSATLDNNVWIFTNFRLNNSFVARNSSATLQGFKVSATDSNITIYSAQANRGTSFGYVRYNAVGSGEQTFNFGLNVTRSAIWMVTFTKTGTPASYPSENHGWQVSADKTITVNAPSEYNVTVQYYYSNRPNVSDQPFIVQHSVVITTAGVVAVVIVFAVIITLWNRAHATKSIPQATIHRQFPKQTQLTNRKDEVKNRIN
jgi:hypothetical protein